MLGFHYFPDSEHYRRQDLNTWLPRLQAAGASWVMLHSAAERAIPEAFLRALLEAGLQVAVHLPLRPEDPRQEEVLPILDAYARWGVRYVVLFERPNQRAQWKDTDWTSVDVVARFLERLLPLAGRVVRRGMRPVFPPLEPGGDYWDTAFLRAALTDIASRQPALLDALTLSALAHAGDRPLDWGAGGPERWPGTRAYYTPPGEQDQRGFAIAEWYAAISQAACGRRLPMLLLEAGSPGGWRAVPDGLSAESHRQRTLRLAAAVRAPQADAPGLPSLPPEVLACCFPAVGADLPHAWYTPEGAPTPLGERWLRQYRRPPAQTRRSQPPAAPQSAVGRLLRHYVLLPPQARRGDTWHTRVLPALLNTGATLGFSLREAALAAQVTVLGDERAFPDTALQKLRAAGCRVVRLSGSGTELAHFLEQVEQRTAG